MPEQAEEAVVTLQLDNPAAFAQIAMDDRVVITIPASDTPTIAFAEPTAISLPEGETTQLIITSAPAPVEDLVLRLEFDGSELAVSPNPATLRSGQSASSVTITINDDGMPERGTETAVMLDLDDLDAFAQIAVEDKVVITIPSSDTPTLAFAGKTHVTLDKNRRTTQLTITSIPAPLEDLVVDLQFEETTDFLIMPNPTTVRSKQSAATFNVTIDDQAAPNAKTTIRLTLKDPRTFAQIDEDHDEVTITITQSGIRIKIKVYLEGAL